MPYWLQFSLFLVSAGVVAAAVGYVAGFFGPWTLAIALAVTVPLSIFVGRLVMKRDRL